MKSLGVVVLACLAALFVLMLIVRGQGPQAPALAAPPQSALRDELAALRGAIEALAAEVAALREAREAPSLGPPAAARAPVDPAQGEELVQQIQGLVTAVEDLQGDVRRAKSAPAAPRRLADPEALLRLPPEWNGLGRLAEMPEVRRDILHLGWTVQQVLERYGTPTEISFNEGSLSMSYFSEQVDVVFELVDGVVVRVHA